MRFIGRRKELALFSKELGSGRAASILLYGRRRVGKTTLFRTVLNEASGIRILYTCLPAELAENARTPSAAILRELGSAPLSFSNLTDLFSFLFTRNEKRKVQAIEGLWIKAFGMISSSGFEEIADEAIFISSEDLYR